MAKSLSPLDKLTINTSLEMFNHEHGINFQISIRGRFVYVFVMDGDVENKLGRIEYHGKPDHWSFAIYKYSSNSYHPDEFGYPGFFEMDGTLQGALKACLGWYSFMQNM